MDYLEVHKLRLNRATLHINELIQHTEKFLASNPFEAEIESYKDHNKDCVRFIYKVNQEPPKYLSVIAGDCIHNLRAILDNIIWSLGQVYPSSDIKAKNQKLYFPVFHKKSEYEKKLNTPDLIGIHNFPVGAQNLIESLQPYNNTNPESHRLSILHELWNADKHRSPDIVGAANGGTSITGFKMTEGGFSAGHYINHGKSFGQGEVSKEGLSEDSKVNLLNIQICFGENGPASGYIVTAFLYELLQFVNQLLIRFDSFFPKCNGDS